MDLAANLTPLAPLLGSWSGPGAGAYPTIESFTYTEELTFTNIGKPFLVYQQRTWSPTGGPMHTESGFVRMPSPGLVEMTLAQPTGQTELLEGTWEEENGGFRIVLEGQILNTASAKVVDATKRAYTFLPGSLRTLFAMAAVGQPMTHHLESTLEPRVQ